MNATPRPRTAGPLTRASWQLFTVDKTPVCEPVPVDVPNEITLAQLVSAYIIPSGFNRLDANTVFQWNLEIAPARGKKDKTKREVVQIPQKIPVGFNPRVTTNTLHENDDGRGPDRVVIRVTSAAAPQMPAAPLPAGDDPLGNSSAPGFH
jgi:hypothetical protein